MCVCVCVCSDDFQLYSFSRCDRTEFTTGKLESVSEGSLRTDELMLNVLRCHLTY